MSLLLALRERDLPAPAGAVLMYPWVDLTGRTQRPPAGFPADLLTGDGPAPRPGLPGRTGSPRDAAAGERG